MKDAVYILLKLIVFDKWQFCSEIVSAFNLFSIFMQNIW